MGTFISILFVDVHLFISSTSVPTRHEHVSSSKHEWRHSYIAFPLISVHHHFGDDQLISYALTWLFAVQFCQYQNKFILYVFTWLIEYNFVILQILVLESSECKSFFFFL